MRIVAFQTFTFKGEYEGVNFTLEGADGLNVSLPFYPEPSTLWVLREFLAAAGVGEEHFEDFEFSFSEVGFAGGHDRVPGGVPGQPTTNVVDSLLHT